MVTPGSAITSRFSRWLRLMKMAQDLYLFIDWRSYPPDAPELTWLINQRLQQHLLGFGFREGAD
jgi:hypothetical protein